MSVEERDPQRAENSEHWSVISRRTLLRAGWTAPVIITVAPAVAFAASGTTPPTSVSPGGSSSKNTKTPSSTVTPSSSGTPSSAAGPGAGGSGGGLPEQSSSGPQPARIKRGFTG